MGVTKTVQYEISEDGDCSSCKYNWLSHCRAFCSDVNSYESGKYIQCQECISFLAQEKAKVKKTLENLECRIVWNSQGEPEELKISFNAENKQRLIEAYGKRDIKKLVIVECEL